MVTVTKQSPTPAKPPPDGKQGVVDRLKRPVFDSGLKMLIYGDSGTGKTTLAGTFPAPLCWAVCSSSEYTDIPEELRSLPEEVLDQIEYVNLREAGELRDLIQYAKGGRFNTFVLDHSTGLENLVIKQYTGRPVPEQRSWGMLDHKDWGVVSGMFKDALAPALGLKCNVLCLSQEKVRDPKPGNETSSTKGGAGNVPNLVTWLEYTFSYIVRTVMLPRKEKEEYTVTVAGKPVKRYRDRAIKGKWDYFLQTVKDDVFKAKFRVPDGSNLPELIKNPTYEKIMALIRGEVLDGED